MYTSTSTKLTMMRTPPHRPNCAIAGSGERQLMKSEKAVVTSAMNSGRAACTRVQRTRSDADARVPPSTRSE